MKIDHKRNAVIFATALALALSGLAFAADGQPGSKGPAKSPPRFVGQAVTFAALTAVANGDSTGNLYVPFHWDLAVVNSGDVETTGEVTVTDLLPAHITVSGIGSGQVLASDPRFVCTLTGQSVFCSTTDPIPANGVAIPVASLEVYATSGTSANNGAVVNWSTGATVSPTWTTTLVDTDTRRAKVRARAGGVASAPVGVPFNWSMGLINIGDAPSSDVISIVDDIDPSLVINSITAAPGAVCSQEGNLVSCSTSSSVPPMIGDGDVPDTLIATINVTAPAAGMGAVRHQVTATWIAEAPATTSSSTSYPWWTALVSPPN